MTDTRQMRSVEETRMAQEGQSNAGGMRRVDQNGKPYYDPAPLSDYPKMLYRKTDVEQVQEHADAVGGLKDLPMVINRFDGMLCEMCIAQTATEAEALSELGWDVSPKAAHGIEEGLVAATSAKDDEIAALRAEIAAMQEKPRRGRPPNPVDTSGDVF